MGLAQQFRMCDAPKLAQEVCITWEMLTPTDEAAQMEGPEERDEGFWPTRADYEGDEVAWEKAMQDTSERLDRWRDDAWEFVGVVAKATVLVPIGGASFARYEFQSPGLWGIESDSGDYLAEVFEEQKAELIGHMRTMGTAFAALA